MGASPNGKLENRWSLEDMEAFSSGFSYPWGSMYGIFTYIYHKNQPNVGKYTIHGSFGYVCVGFEFESDRHFFRKTIILSSCRLSVLFQGETWRHCFLTIGVGFQPVLLLTPIREKISYVKLVDAIWIWHPTLLEIPHWHPTFLPSWWPLNTFDGMASSPSDIRAKRTKRKRRKVFESRATPAPPVPWIITHQSSVSIQSLKVTLLQMIAVVVSCMCI